MNRGTFAVLPKEDSVAGNPDNPYEKELANPKAFFAYMEYHSDAFDSGSTWFDARSGTVDISYFDGERIEASFNINMIEFDLNTRDPSHFNYRPPKHIQVNGRFIHNLKHSLRKNAEVFGDYYLCRSDTTLQVADHTPITNGENADYERKSYLDKEAKIEFIFDQPVNAESLEGNVILEVHKTKPSSPARPSVNLESLKNDLFLSVYQPLPPINLSQPFKQITGKIEEVNNKTFRFIPDKDLLDGVYYNMTILGGSTGVKGQNGSILEEDYKWQFSTIVEVNNIEAHVYQVIRDAQLVPSKPTLTRVYVAWKQKDDLPKESQVESFSADVTVKNSTTPINEYKTQEFLIRRPDKFTKEDKKFARDSYNFFGWRPTQRGGSSEIIVTLEPKDQNRDEPKDFESNRPLTVQHWDKSPTLTIDYYFLKTGQWITGVPEKDKNLGHQVVQQGAIFTTQNFPVVKTHSRFKGELIIKNELHSIIRKRDKKNKEYLYGFRKPALAGAFSLLPFSRPFRTDRFVAERLLSATKQSNADLVIGLVPITLQINLLGIMYAFTEEFYLHGGERVALIFIDDKISQESFSNTFAHEVGHAFQLCHAISENDDRGCVKEALNISGFKIADSGLHGWNKVLGLSSLDVNADFIELNAEGDNLSPLMIPGGDELTVHSALEGFITNDHYLRLFETVPSYIAFSGSNNFFATQPPSTFLTQSSISKNNLLIANKQHMYLSGDTPLFNTYEDNSHLVSANSLNTFFAQGSESIDYLLVTGFVDETNNAAVIEPLRFLETTTLEGGSGSYTLELQDTSGTVLSSHAFETFLSIASHGPPSEGPLMFNLTVPYNPKTDRVVVKQGENLLAERIRSPNTPEVSLLTALPNAELQTSITWQGSDADGDELYYDLYYSPNGFDDWRPMAFGVRETSLDIDPSVLEPGPSPKLKLVASDGFNQTEVVTNVTLASEVQILASLPSEGESLDTRESVLVFFNTELDPETLTQDSFVLKDEQGNTVEAELSYDQAARTAMLTPLSVLEPLNTYKVTLSNLVDLYGNALPESLNWSFETTEAVPTLAQIHQLSEGEIDGELTDLSQSSVSLPEACAGISSDLIIPFVPEDSELVSINQEDGCQLEINSTLGFNSARAHIETTIIKNRYRLTQNTQNNKDGRQSTFISFESDVLLGRKLYRKNAIFTFKNTVTKASITTFLLFSSSHSISLTK